MEPQRPRGRGALLLEAMRKAKETVRPGEEVPVEPTKPRGRAALLNTLMQIKSGASAGPPSTTTSTAAITDQLKKVEISEVEGISTLSESNLPIPAAKTEPCTYTGTMGSAIYVTANYIRLNIDPNKGVFEYNLVFEPSVDAKNIRFKILNANIEALGGVKMFDGGSYLYLPIKLPDAKTFFQTPHPIDGNLITMTVSYIRSKPMVDCIHLFNVLFKRVMGALQLSRLGRNYFDPPNSKAIPQHKLEVLPGYAIAVDEYEGGLMLCLDTQHRVLRTQTALDLLNELRTTYRERFKEEASKRLIGAIVMTKYNNKTYPVDDILWNFSPKDDFDLSSGKKISFLEYYKNQHGITIHDVNQPMLLHVAKRKKSQEAVEEDLNLCLIPELCHLTGLTEEMRSDFRVMKDVASFTRVTPHQRLNALRTYLSNVRQSPKAQKVLSEWGMTIEDATIDLNARILSPEMIYFGNNRTFQSDAKGDWTGACSKNAVVLAKDIMSWVIVHTERDIKVAQEFGTNMPKFGETMGCRISRPKLYAIKNDRSSSYVQACDDVINDNVECIVFICPTSRDDLYTAIKKICCSTKPIPSQVIISRTLNNVKKVRTVTLKIALQINCKMGGSLWCLKIPAKGWMVCGLDVFHSPANKKSVCGFVTSVNETMSQWYTTVMMQDKEIIDGLKLAFMRALDEYRNKMGHFPSQVVIYRDGVGDGQLDSVRRHELVQFQDAIACYKLENTHIALVVVQKRINTRIITKNAAGNPPPGTIIDHTITRKYLYDFFLVPQNVTQGTVTPTHYILLHDSAGLKPDHVQKLTYKMCHLYYNWSGTIRVPAPCQYAHKVAYLVGQHIGKVPSLNLNNKLYYL